MLQTINLGNKHLSSSSPRSRYNSLQPPKTEITRKFVNLHFRQDDMTFGKNSHKKASGHEEREDVFYRTFHPKDRQRKHRSHHYYSRKTARETAISQRDTIVGTPFASLDATDPDIPIQVLPSLDRQRYKYLLNVVSGSSKMKRLPEFRIHNKNSSNHQTPQMTSRDASPPKENGSPNIINFSLNFEESKNNPLQPDLQNSYQKMFKNKQLLLKGRYSQTRQNSGKGPDISLLMDDDLMVRQATFENRRKKKTLK